MHTFFERQKRQAAGARLLRAGMSATQEHEMPMFVGYMFQMASPALSAMIINTTCPMTWASVKAFGRVSSEPRFGIRMPTLFTCSRKNRYSARLQSVSRHSRTISQSSTGTLASYALRIKIY